MRLRNVVGSREKIEESIYVVKRPILYKGIWHRKFGNDNPIHLEIGTGKGKFLIELAKRNPNINFIGIEKYSSVLVRAVESLEELNLENILFLRFDAEDMEDIFAKGEIANIYLNFSDPWPKDKHSKRRLTSDRFLLRYEKILKDTGKIIQKTDNKDLFEFSIESVKENGWIVDYKSLDYHKEKEAVDNVMTEYEEKFSKAGNPIYCGIYKKSIY